MLLCTAFISAFAQDVVEGQDNFEKGSMEFVEQVMDLITIDRPKYTLSFYPLLDYSEQVGLDVGIMPVIVFKSHLQEVQKSKYSRPTSIVPSFSYSTKGQLHLDADLIYYNPNGWLVTSRMLWTRIPDTFFGIGGPTGEETSFFANTFGLEGVVLHPITDKFFLGGSYDLSWVSNSGFSNGGLNENINGYEGGFLTGIGLDARFDTRNDILYPTKGEIFTFDYRYYFGDFTFQHFELDLASFWSIGSPKNVIGVQGYYEFVVGDDVPFYKLPSLGGSRLLRSIGHPNKYIDNHIYYLQTEYRRHIYGRFGAAFFGGWGNRREDWSASLTRDGKWMYGAGLRFQLLPKDHINFRLDIGKSPGEEVAIFFTMRESF